MNAYESRRAYLKARDIRQGDLVDPRPVEGAALSQGMDTMREMVRQQVAQMVRERLAPDVEEEEEFDPLDDDGALADLGPETQYELDDEVAVLEAELALFTSEATPPEEGPPEGASEASENEATDVPSEAQ